MEIVIQQLNIIEGKLTTSYWLQIILISILNESTIYNIICFITNHDFCLIIFWIHYALFSLSLSSLVEYIKLIVTNNWIFHVSDCLRSFTMSLKYGLILSRYSSTDSVLYFYHSYFYIQNNYYSKDYLILPVYNNCLLFSYSKRFLSFLSSISFK